MRRVAKAIGEDPERLVEFALGTAAQAGVSPSAFASSLRELFAPTPDERIAMHERTASALNAYAEPVRRARKKK